MFLAALRERKGGRLTSTNACLTLLMLINMPATADLRALTAGVPVGSWVALSHDEKRIVVYGADLQEVLSRAKSAGEADPIVFRVPPAEIPVFF
jgi:hypothetical protein